MPIKLTKELLTSIPEEDAKNLYQENQDNKVSTTQIRKYYNDFLVLNSKAKLLSEEEFRSKLLPLVALSKAKLFYSVGRKNITETFAKTISFYIDRIETKSDFQNFLDYYQALIGYATYYSEKNGKGKGKR